jgi:3-isopropylmalate/(R)-2-methylmalate dehydratase small subunit
LFQRTEKNEGYRLTVDLENQTLTDDLGLRLSFQIDPFRRECLLKGLDDIGLALRHTDRIAAYEEYHHPSATMYEPVDATLAKPAP